MTDNSSTEIATPRCDGTVAQVYRGHVNIGFARRLERELIFKTEQVRSLQTANDDLEQDLSIAEETLKEIRTVIENTNEQGFAYCKDIAAEQDQALRNINDLLGEWSLTK